MCIIAQIPISEANKMPPSYIEKIINRRSKILGTEKKEKVQAKNIGSFIEKGSEENGRQSS